MKDPRTWEVVIFETPSSERTKALFTHKRLGELTVQWRNKRARRSLSTLVLLWRLSDRMFRNGLHVVTFSFILRVSNLVWHLLIDSSASLAANQRHGPCPTEAWKQDKKKAEIQMARASQAFLKATMGADFWPLIRCVLWDWLQLSDMIDCLAKTKPFFLQMLLKIKFDPKPYAH